MTKAEQRLIDAARVRAICNDRYAEAQDAVAMNLRTDNDVIDRAHKAAEKAYQAAIEGELNSGQSRAFNEARKNRDRLQEGCKLAEAAYQLALQALTESPA